MTLHEPPQRMSRYRSVRRQNAQAPNAQQALANAHASPPPPLPTVQPLDPAIGSGTSQSQSRTVHLSPSQAASPQRQHSASIYPRRPGEHRPPRNELRTTQQQSSFFSGNWSNGASLKPPVSPQALSPGLVTPDLEDISVQTAQPVRMQPVYRSLSRYHKKGRQEAAAAGSQNTKGAPPMPALAQRQEPRGGGHDSVREKKLNGEMQGHRPSGPPVADGLQLPIRTTSARDVPMPQDSTPAVSQGSQAQASVSTSTLHPSRSRYRRRQAPTTQDPLPQSRTPLFAHELAPMAALHAPENHQDALRKLQRQASLPTPSQTPPAHGLITKASLNRLPDDTEPDAAVHRRVSQFRAQGAERRHREEKQVEDTQKQVKKLLDAEAERHRRMHARIQAQREREEAARQADESDKEKRLRQIEEEQQEKERVLAERERQLEERERQAKQKENGKDGEASVSRGRRTREEQSKVDERTDTGSPHKRKESKEDRTQRHRKRSLSALEGKPIHRQKSDEAPPPVPTPPEPADSRVPLVSFLKKRKPTESPKPAGVDRSKSIKKPEQATKAKAAATAPGIDAPISAVNAGERRVRVECNKSSIMLPVTPTTTPIDLIRSAATCLTESINPKACVLFESFGKIGVQRPLRKYERIRDVINSWDHDEQNSLILLPSAAGNNDENLEVSSVLSAQPNDFSCELYYSTKPGKWDKKWVTLRSDGQVLYAKSEGHTEPKDMTIICHMTDFDIYTPTHSSKAKKIRPPKKLCFAIKSQQKSNMFESLDNFAHFFSTSDKRLASEWYQAIHGWRSWYLVNVLGEGQKIEQRKVDASNADGAPLLPEPSRAHRVKGSQDSHYQLGSFKPLLDLKLFATNDEQHAAEAGDLVTHARNNSSSGPPSAFPKWLIDNIDSGQPSNHTNATSGSGENAGLKRSGTLRHSASVKRTPTQRRKPFDPAARDPKLNANVNPADAIFAAGGLLGRSYSTAQKRNSVGKDGPFFVGGLLNTIGSSNNVNGFDSSSSHPNGPAHHANVVSTAPNGADTSASRNKSRRDPNSQRPLLNLHNNSYTEAPQHKCKGRGYIPETIGTGGLVDLATSPERPAGAGTQPPPTARPTTKDETPPLPLTLTRSKSHHNRPPSPSVQAPPFHPNGLISTTDARQSKNFWNPFTSTQGKGFMDGSKANGPMLDLQEESVYVQGSLLRKVEGERPVTSGMVFERGKGREVVVGTGEGV